MRGNAQRDGRPLVGSENMMKMLSEGVNELCEIWARIGCSSDKEHSIRLWVEVQINRVNATINAIKA